MTTKYLLPLAFVAVLSVTAAHAADKVSTGSFTAADVNGDGAVDSREFEAMVARSFADLDANGDGVLDAKEGEPFYSDPVFAAAFKGEIGHLTFKAMLERLFKDFHAADRNHDGRLTGG